MGTVLDQLRQAASPARAGFADNKPGGLTSTTFPVQVQRVRQDIGKWREALSRAESVFWPDRVGLLSSGEAKRRPFTTAEVRLIRAHYRDCTAAELAARLGRTVGSLRGFIQARPDLHKRTLLQAA